MNVFDNSSIFSVTDTTVEIDYPQFRDALEEAALAKGVGGIVEVLTRVCLALRRDSERADLDLAIEVERLSRRLDRARL